MAKSRRNRRRGARSKSRSNRRSRRSRSNRRSRRSRRRRRQNGGFAAILKEAVVPIAFLGGNIKLKKGTFGNKKVMIPIFKNMNQAKYERDRHSTRKMRKRKRRRSGKKRRRSR